MAAITINVDSKDKDTFSEICNKMGMNVTTAINVFIKAVNRTRKIPFEIEAEEDENFNEETLAAMQESLEILSGKIKAKRYTNVDDMFNDILCAEPDSPDYN